MEPIYKCRICGTYTSEPIHCGTLARLLLDSDARVRLSKLVSGILRHFPGFAGLSLGEDGFVELRDLVEAIKKWRRGDYSWVTEGHVVAIAELDPKGRFEIRGGRIRARYGHSIKVRIEYETARDVSSLYHGTQAERLAHIMREGLKPLKRLYVHLTPSLEDAWENARGRSDRPVVLVVDARRMVRDGIPVYEASRAVYLAPCVPPRYILAILSE